MSEVTSQNINSTFVVLDDANNAIPIANSDRFYEKLEQQFGDFQGKRLISHYTFWHTAKVCTSSSVLFITPGEGTQSRSLS
ncbi:hypothetical protein NIES22_67610 (plasmid) [Calothrix brevissima NIES-22]|nr:hypothetical protein NIES22_67610 [Calothrix brevissima NIES-22]